MALLNAGRKVLAWRSVFEGYLPLSAQEVPAGGPGSSTPRPAGSSTTSGRCPRAGREDLLPLPRLFSEGARGDVLPLPAQCPDHLRIIAAAGLVVFRGLSLLQSGYMNKTREAENPGRKKNGSARSPPSHPGSPTRSRTPSTACPSSSGSSKEGAGRDLREHRVRQDEVRKISRIVDRFSDVLKPLVVRPETFPIGEAVASVTESLSSEFPGLRDRVRFEGRGELPVRADRELFSLVLANLLGNSLEAGAAGEIVVRADRDRRRIRLSVLDSGPGIPPERLDRVFEPFFSTKQGGMGIGLYLAARAVEAQGGRIEVRSRGGEGAEFIVHIPGG